MMQKYRITRMDVETGHYGDAPEITIKLFTTDNNFSVSDGEVLKKSIEGIVCPDSETFHGVDYTVYGGRENGKTFRAAQVMANDLIGKYFCKENGRFLIKKVIFNSPATIVFWADGTKTVVKCQDGDVYSPEVGIAMCYMKKALGNQSNFNNTFKKHVPAALVAQTLSKEHLDAVKKALEEDKPVTKTYSHLDTEAIYRILRVNKWTVKEFAQVVGVDHSSVYHWLKGGGIKKRNISKMVKALHVPEEVIIKEEK